MSGGRNREGGRSMIRCGWGRLIGEGFARSWVVFGFLLQPWRLFSILKWDEGGKGLTSPSSEACSRIVALWPVCAIEIAAASPPRPAPTMATWNWGLAMFCSLYGGKKSRCCRRVRAIEENLVAQWKIFPTWWETRK